MRGRQWRADEGSIIACSQDKSFNHIDPEPARKTVIYHSGKLSRLDQCRYNHGWVRIHFNYGYAKCFLNFLLLKAASSIAGYSDLRELFTFNCRYTLCDRLMLQTTEKHNL